MKYTPHLEFIYEFNYYDGFFFGDKFIDKIESWFAIPTMINWVLQKNKSMTKILIIQKKKRGIKENKREK